MPDPLARRQCDQLESELAERCFIDSRIPFEIGTEITVGQSELAEARCHTRAHSMLLHDRVGDRHGVAALFRGELICLGITGTNRYSQQENAEQCGADSSSCNIIAQTVAALRLSRYDRNILALNSFASEKRNVKIASFAGLQDRLKQNEQDGCSLRLGRPR